MKKLPLVPQFDSYEQFERLNEHLAEINVPLEGFARSHEYTITPRLVGGLYPRVSLIQSRSIIRSIQIAMDFDQNEKLFEDFFPEIPYTIFGAAFVDDEDTLIRWSGPSIRIERLPFCVLVPTLKVQLEHFHQYLSGFTEQYLRACAHTSPLSPRSPD